MSKKKWYTEDVARIYANYVQKRLDDGKTIQQVLEQVFPKGLTRGFKEQVISYSEVHRPPTVQKRETPKTVREANTVKFREAYKRVPAHVRQIVSRLPFTVRDVKVLQRKSKYGMPGDVTFRSSDGKTYAIQKRGRK